MRRLPLLFAALLACGLIAAGCGDDNNDDSGDSAATTESAPVDTTPGVDTASEDETTTSPDDTKPGGALAEGVQVCKDNVRSSAAGLSEDLRSDLEGLCEKAGEGNEDDLREAS